MPTFSVFPAICFFSGLVGLGEGGVGGGGVLQLLVKLSPSHRLALEVDLEVDTYNDSRGSHIR